MKLKFQNKLELLSGSHIAYRRTDRQTERMNPVNPPPPNQNIPDTISDLITSIFILCYYDAFFFSK